MLRLQLFEFNESSFCPAFIRDSIVEVLGRSIRLGRFYNGAAQGFCAFLKHTGCRRLLDLCSGTGESVAILIDAVQGQGGPEPEFILSDLFPKIGCMARRAKRYPGRVSVYDKPLDATAIPVDIDHDGRTFLSSFHHFPPAVAAAIIGESVRQNKPLFIIEPFPRDLRCFVPVFFLNMLAYMINPFICDRQRLLKIIFTFPLPLIPLCGLWDGLVSLNRVYGQAQLLAMAAGTPGFRWHYRVVKVGLLARVTFFYGVPEK